MLGARHKRGDPLYHLGQCQIGAVEHDRAADHEAVGRLRGGRIDAHGDHRLALLGAVAGLGSETGVEVVGMEAADVSFPRFADHVAELVR